MNATRLPDRAGVGLKADHYQTVLEDKPVDVDMGASEHAAVLRPALPVQVRIPAPGGAAFTAALNSGAPLGEAAQQGMDADEKFDLASHLRLIFELGAVARVNPPRDEQA